MKADIIASRPVVGASTEFQVLLRDNDTGRIIICGGNKQRLPVVRVAAVDQNRPASSTKKMPPGALEVRSNAVYVNSPMAGEVIAIVAGRASYDQLGETNDPVKSSVYLICQSMTLIDRVGELAEGVDETPDAERKSTGRRKTDGPT